MKLHTISTGSKGNCYVLRSNTGKCLILEAGVPFRKVLPVIDYKPSSVEAVLISHEHGDHNKYEREYRSAIRGSLSDPYCEFSGDNFELMHDVATSGFCIYHPTTGWIVYASDTKFVPVKLKNIKHFIIECNYTEERLQEAVFEGKTDRSLAMRIRETHMSLDTLKHYFSMTAYHNNIETVTLIHLSETHGDPERMKREVSEIVGCRTYIASPGEVINL